MQHAAFKRWLAANLVLLWQLCLMFMHLSTQTYLPTSVCMCVCLCGEEAAVALPVACWFLGASQRSCYCLLAAQCCSNWNLCCSAALCWYLCFQLKILHKHMQRHICVSCGSRTRETYLHSEMVIWNCWKNNAHSVVPLHILLNIFIVFIVVKHMKPYVALVAAAFLYMSGYNVCLSNNNIKHSATKVEEIPTICAQR